MGKSTLASAIATHVGTDVIELDDLMHGPNWTPTPTPEFRAKVMTAITASEGDDSSGGWVIPGNYRNVADLVQRRADTIVWLDLPRRVSMWRLLKRSVRRVATRAEVCNGNRERLANLFSRDPNRNVLLWSWQHHDQYRSVYDGYASGDFWSHARVVRLQSAADVTRFLNQVTTAE